MPRRHSQTVVVVAALAVISGVALAFASAENPTTQDPRATPQTSLTTLLEGNARYIKGMATSENRPENRPALLTTHEPIAGILRCSDARVSPEIYFDQPLGALFVTAVAGNIITPENIASFEYTVGVLGTKLIVVMGHRRCGAVETAIKMRNKTEELPGSLPMLIDQIIVPCTLDADPDDVAAYEHEAVICNANKGVTQLLARSPMLAEAVAKGELKVIAGVQDLKTGKFTITSP